MALGWGVMGAGKLADIAIAPAIERLEGNYVAAACGRDLGRTKEFADRHGAGGAYTDYQELLADPAVDVVYISTPNSMHKDQVIAGLRAGKHVLVEKPMALSVRDGEEMVAVAAAGSVIFGVGLHLRHKRTNREARRIIAEGGLGRVFLADISLGAGKGLFPYNTWRADPTQAGGGTLLHQGTHTIDLLSFLTGREVVEVACVTSGEPEDVFTAVCTLDDGSLATLSSHQLHAGTRPDWVVMGETAWLQCRGGVSPVAGDELFLHEGSKQTSIAATEISAYDAEISAFASAVAGDGEFDATGHDGLRNIAVFDALYQSARERRTVAVAQINV